MKLMIRFTSLVPLLIVTTTAWEDTCTPFKNIYQDGTELCEKMWDDSFVVVDDEVKAYTMWFFDGMNNPNDAVTANLFANSTPPEQCHLQYFHKDVPGPEDDNMRECHPWKENACCNSSTVQSVDTLNGAYGKGYEWDRCGPLSQACERFFVQEACFYECEPSAGLFRKWNRTSQSDHPDFNDWQMHKMPIRKSFCDAWYTACYNDRFCGKGSFFECEAFYHATKQEEEEKVEKLQKTKDRNLTIGLGVAATLAVLGMALALFLVHREQSGHPVFKAVNNNAGVSS